MPFNIDLELDKFKGLFPEQPPFDQIINYDKDDEDSVWKRTTPSIITFAYMEQEKVRLRQGVWIKIKDTVLWIPPNYYHFLQNGTAGSVVPDFRLKELKSTWFKMWTTQNPYATGTFEIKNRKDGRTTRVMSDALFTVQDGQNTHGQINIQSKTNQDAITPCWMFLKAQWMGYPAWLKEIFYSDFASGDNIETRMMFSRSQSVKKDLRGNDIIIPSRMIQMKHYPAVFNAQDGSSDVLKCIADEFCKWQVCSPAKFLTNAEQFIRVGGTRKGIFEIFSSPADVNHRYVDEVYRIWKDSDPNKLDEFGTTKSGLFAYHSNPLDGIEGYYDKFGDADPNRIYEWIMYLRSKKTKEELMGEIRANPLNEEEMFGSTDDEITWDNTDGLKKRHKFLITTNYKDEETLEPKYLWGNLEWKDGIIDSAVVFRPNPVANEFCIKRGKFCFSYMPDDDTPLTDIYTPPKFIESCLGIDPFHLGKGTRKGEGSMAGCVTYQFRKLGDELFAPRPTGMYNCRPKHIHEFFEDMVMMAVYTRSIMQYERSSDEIERYFDDRGYGKWVLEIKGNKGAIQRGKAGGAFITQVMAIVNIITNLPVKTDEPYLLENYWFDELVQQIIKFDREDTHKYDLFMGFAQALFGAVHIMGVKNRKDANMATKMMNYLLS